MHNIIKDDIEGIFEKIDFTELKDKSILITGASGLVGVYTVSCLKEIYKDLNIKIYVWVRNEIDSKFIELFNDCYVIKKDITERSSFNDLPNFDYIIHAAGYGQPGKFLENKIKTIEINTTSTINLFNKLNIGGKFLFVSTSELYSGLDYDSIDEYQIGTTNTNHPRSCYIEGKRCGESICYAYRQMGVDVKIVRLSLAYGPGTKKDDNRVLNSIIQKGIFDENIKLMDQGDAVRTYCYITDVIEMFWNILFFGKENLYNVGGESVISILGLAKIIGNEFNKEVMLPNVTQVLKGSPKIVNISIDRYLKEFKKNNFTTLQDGVGKTIKWQKFLYDKTSQ
jgi:UDP-glucuronate decarboxylase